MLYKVCIGTIQFDSNSIMAHSYIISNHENIPKYGMGPTIASQYTSQLRKIEDQNQASVELPF